MEKKVNESITIKQWSEDEFNDILDHREKVVLLLLIEDYIDLGVPISSLQLVERHKLKWSSATVRYILSELNEKGYIYAPHRSAGRLPTTKGYRYYIKNLPIDLPPYSPSKEKQNIIQREFLSRKFEIPDILESSCKLISILTNYMGIAIPPILEKNILRHIEIIDVGGEEVLMILLTRSGSVYSRLIHLEERVPRNILEQISRFLNENFSGMDIKEIHQLLNSGDVSPIGEMYRYASLIMRTLSAHFKTLNEVEDVIIAGIDRFIEELESRGEHLIDISMLYNLKEVFRNILVQSSELDDIVVSIEGDRNPQLNGLSVITGSYSMGDRKIGAMGVVGPNRMNYKSVIQILEYFRLMISSMITKINR
ncbi:MAG: heat-inducible transcriptional repressor HrcA [Leptospiraceae bacterium]|nr:heat-inducible transcriptional repressor HrcA [Leptospiraceae bacterium]MDW7976542.1 heat-inducible transcriptional repressor HrcA [Leptospiraceae bacterium]